MARVKKAQNKSSGANLGFEATLWAAADKLRGHMDTAEYKHVVQSEKFVAAHGGRIGDIAIYGQESNPTTWKLAKINLAIHSIDEQIAHWIHLK